MAFYQRSAWGGRTPTAGPLGPVGVVAIHHTAAQNPPHAFSPQRWKNLENGEVAGGYDSLAYHFGVTPSGDIVEIRGWGQKGAATGGWNDRSVAIVFDGYFHPPFNEQPTEAAIQAAGHIVAQGMANGSLTSNNCEGHRTLTAGTKWATACPGDHLFPQVGRIESIAAAGGGGTPSDRRSGDCDMYLAQTTDKGGNYAIYPTGAAKIAVGIPAGQYMTLAKKGIPGGPCHSLELAAEVKFHLKAKLGRTPTNTEVEQQFI